MVDVLVATASAVRDGTGGYGVSELSAVALVWSLRGGANK